MFMSIPGLQVHSTPDFPFQMPRVDPRPLSKILLFSFARSMLLLGVYLKSCPQNQQTISAQISRRMSLHEVLTTEILLLK